MLFGSLGYQKAEFDDFPGAAGPGTNYEGNRLQNAPEWSGHIGAQYTWTLSGEALIYLRGDYVQSGDYFVRSSNEASSFVESFGYGNARLGYQSASGVWLLELWAKNIGDKEYIVGRNRPLGGLFGQDGAVYGEPRTYGVRLAARF